MGNTSNALGRLEPSTGTITESELADLARAFEFDLPDEIGFPFTKKLTQKHTLTIERRSAQRVTTNGLVDLFNWRVSENMVTPLQRV